MEFKITRIFTKKLPCRQRVKIQIMKYVLYNKSKQLPTEFLESEWRYFGRLYWNDE